MPGRSWESVSLKSGSARNKAAWLWTRGAGGIGGDGVRRFEVQCFRKREGAKKGKKKKR